jgi:hypothetical protein
MKPQKIREKGRLVHFVIFAVKITQMLHNEKPAEEFVVYIILIYIKTIAWKN